MGDEGDFIIITDIEDPRYLKIGKIIKTEVCKYDGEIEFYEVLFCDEEIIKYDYSLFYENKCKILPFL